MENEIFKNIESHSSSKKNQQLLVDLFEEKELFDLLEKLGNTELAIYVQTNLTTESQLLNVLEQDSHYSKELLSELTKIRKD